jgi:hypothetical protein
METTVPSQHSKIHAIRESPYRCLAREAVALAHEDVTSGVLHERIAAYLCLQLRALHGKPTARLADVPVGEQAQMFQFAAGILGLVTSIHSDIPPTAAEVHRYRHRQDLARARARVRVEALTHHHRLSVWRPEPDRPGRELATCERCGAGATIHTETFDITFSELLEADCRERRPSPFSMTGVQNHG